MMQKRNKKGLSPIVATVLLISLAVILAIIIFLWARSVVTENTQKFQEPVQNSCGNVQFQVQANTTSMSIVNQGNVPIYSFKVLKKNQGSLESMSILGSPNVLSGQTAVVSFQTQVQKGDELLVVPILLGETSTAKKQYVCDNQYGVSAPVS